MAETIEMPVVGKSFYTYCKKCETDRYQTVLALPTATSAKLKCEVCGSSSTWKVPKEPGAAKKTATPGAPRGAAARAKANAEAARSAAHNAEYESLTKSHGSAAEVPYNMKGKFEVNSRIKHPTFGQGFVKNAQADRIEVVFPDEVRSLVHNRR